MPTQAQLDKEQNRTKAHTGIIGRQAGSGGIVHDLSTSFIVPKKEFPQTGKRPLQDDAIDSVSRDRLIQGSEGGGGGGTPDTPFILCANGVPISGKILFEPDA